MRRWVFYFVSIIEFSLIESKLNFHSELDWSDWLCATCDLKLKKILLKKMSFEMSDLLLLLFWISSELLLLLLPAEDQSELQGRCLLWFYLSEWLHSLILTLLKRQVATIIGYILPVPKRISFSLPILKNLRAQINQINRAFIAIKTV